MEEVDMDSGDFRITLQVILTVDQLDEIRRYLYRNKINPKMTGSKVDS